MPHAQPPGGGSAVHPRAPTPHCDPGAWLHGRLVCGGAANLAHGSARRLGLRRSLVHATVSRRARCNGRSAAVSPVRYRVQLGGVSAKCGRPARSGALATSAWPRPGGRHGYEPRRVCRRAHRNAGAGAGLLDPCRPPGVSRRLCPRARPFPSRRCERARVRKGAQACVSIGESAQPTFADCARSGPRAGWKIRSDHAATSRPQLGASFLCATGSMGWRTPATIWSREKFAASWDAAAPNR